MFVQFLWSRGYFSYAFSFFSVFAVASFDPESRKFSINKTESLLDLCDRFLVF